LIDFLDLYRYEISYLTQPEVFWSRRVLEKCGMLREDFQRCFDFEYWVRAVATGFSVSHIDNEIACFRRHPQQKTHHLTGGLIEEIRIAKEYMQLPNIHRIERNDFLSIRRGIRWAHETVYYLSASEASSSGHVPRAIHLWLSGALAGFPSSILSLSTLRWLRRIIVIGLKARPRGSA
jgi:hypothetical protein